MFSRIPNLRIHNFFHEIFPFFSFKTRYVDLIIEIKNVAKTVYFQKKRHFAVPLKEKKNRGFVDSEFVKICHEQGEE